MTAGTPSATAHGTPQPEPAPTRTVKDPGERRAQLLDVARTLFLQRGVAATTFGDIAGAAGVTRGLVYHYFGDKQHLVDLVLREYVNQFTNAVRAWDRQRVPGDIDGALHSCIEVLRGHMHTTTSLRRALEQTEGAGLYNYFLDQVVTALVDCLQQTTVKAYAQRHHIAITHVRQTFTVLIYGLIALMRTQPDTPNEVLADIVRQTLHLQEGDANKP